MAETRTSAGRRAGLAIILSAVALGGCALDDHPVLHVSNGTSEPLEVVLEFFDGQELTVVEELSPGKEIPYDRMGTCENAHLVARNLNGVEVARREGPVCRPSEWTITSP